LFITASITAGAPGRRARPAGVGGSAGRRCPPAATRPAPGHGPAPGPTTVERTARARRAGDVGELGPADAGPGAARRPRTGEAADEKAVGVTGRALRRTSRGPAPRRPGWKSFRVGGRAGNALGSAGNLTRRPNDSAGVPGKRPPAASPAPPGSDAEQQLRAARDTGGPAPFPAASNHQGKAPYGPCRTVAPACPAHLRPCFECIPGALHPRSSSIQYAAPVGALPAELRSRRELRGPRRESEGPRAGGRSGDKPRHRRTPFRPARATARRNRRPTSPGEG